MAHPSCDPLQAQGLNQINSPAAQTVFGFTPLSPDGCPALRTNATGRTPDKAEYSSRRIAPRAYVPQAGHPIRQ
ncbi:hypothetical protein GGR21_001893 [Dysgonomonas hofstadii]|uniref:Uncharacterized protein n=1 Tax=Dysgonomonas hofstadii TaxID=637886 RepID=A0A840CU10_9BACT|nr:hypothetical protein [Dysgonomonas hofstadii]MBB4035992.1 hypothetical protein [Dysgonomonas hofstadii]